MSELRKDPVSGRWVIIAPDRGKRPTDFFPGPEEADSNGCPFCPGREAQTPPEIIALRPNNSIPDGPGWEVRVIPNKFSALTQCLSEQVSHDDLYPSIAGMGLQEVIIETPEHGIAMENLSASKIAQCFSVFRDRMVALQRNPAIRHVLVFKNHGKSAGASLSHSHAQVMALPMVPDLLRVEAENAQAYHALKGRCLFCNMIESEFRQKTRVALETDRYIAFCPYAARMPFETWILPKLHRPRYEEEPDFLSFAEIFGEVMRRIRKHLNAAPYNFFIHTAPSPDGIPRAFHWHLEILPRTAQLAGFELGGGQWINPVPPEVSAEILRDAGS